MYSLTGDEYIEKAVKTYSKSMLNAAYSLLGSVPDAEDAVQESLLWAWKGIHSLKDNSLLKAWLFKILANKCKTLLMKKNKMPDSLPVEEYEFLVDYEEEDSLISSAELKDALSTLTPPDAQIILLSIISLFFIIFILFNLISRYNLLNHMTNICTFILRLFF